MKRIIFALCLLATAAFFSCSRNALTISGGSSSEVVGKALYANGQPARGAVVRLHSTDYLADTTLFSQSSQIGSDADVVTDDSGVFVLTNVQRGNYSIEVNDLMSNAALVRCSVNSLDSFFAIPADTLKPTGSITGTLALSSADGSNVFIQVFGLRRITRIAASSAKFTINDVPNGQYTIRIVASSSASAHKIGDVAVSPGSQTDLGALELASPTSACAFSRRIVINTSPTGANVLGNVYNFPLLIRLHDTNFTFSQALKNGDDLRFTKADSIDLPFEIEQWDSTQGQAEIWVKIDTVLGNSQAQYITMRWGNSLAVARSSGSSVFDTANGFQGVWHLAQIGNGIAYDATANHFDGISTGMNSTSTVPGVIGSAQEFNGFTSFIQMSGTAGSSLNFPENGHYTVSAWVNTDTLDTLNHCIFAKGHEQYYLKQKWSMQPLSSWEFVEYHDKSGWQSTQAAAISKTWKYLVGKRDGYKQYFYCDGELVDSTYFSNSGFVPRNTGSDCTIGRFMQSVTSPSNDGYCYFNGKIDEVRIASAAQSADWIKLCFMNQKANDALVVFVK